MLHLDGFSGIDLHRHCDVYPEKNKGCGTCCGTGSDFVLMQLRRPADNSIALVLYLVCAVERAAGEIEAERDGNQGGVICNRPLDQSDFQIALASSGSRSFPRLPRANSKRRRRFALPAHSKRQHFLRCVLTGKHTYALINKPRIAFLHRA